MSIRKQHTVVVPRAAYKRNYCASCGAKLIKEKVHRIYYATTRYAYPKEVDDYVTEYQFNAFSSNDTVKESIAWGENTCIVAGTNLILEEVDGKFGYRFVAFQRGEEIYTSMSYADIFEIQFVSVVYRNVSEFEKIDPPEFIELYRRKI